MPLTSRTESEFHLSAYTTAPSVEAHVLVHVFCTASLGQMHDCALAFQTVGHHKMANQPVSQQTHVSYNLYYISLFIKVAHTYFSKQ
jgi:hypothetical protein